MQITGLPTPSLILDMNKLQINASRMADRAKKLGVALRPHLKTAKSAEVARIAGVGSGITVSTLAEAEFFASHGIGDLVLATTLPIHKIERAQRINANMTVLCHEFPAAQAIRRAGLPALIEVDCGGGRTGLLPTDKKLEQVRDALADSFVGVLTHAGHAYQAHSWEEITQIAEQERAAVANIKLDAPIRSVGSTPTAVFAEHLDGVTEMRPGVYLFGDLFQSTLGTCGVDDIAISVLATVIHHNKHRTVVDAGGLALSMDRSTQGTTKDHGFGLVTDPGGTPLRLTIDEVHQEHGIIQGPTPLKVGSKVRILPNHACMTAAGHPGYHVVEGQKVVDYWKRCTGW